MKFLNNYELSNSRPMMVGYLLSFLITLGSCKTHQNFSKKDRENLRVSDSIARANKDDLILDYREENEVQEIDQN